MHIVSISSVVNVTAIFKRKIKNTGEVQENKWDDGRIEW